MNATAFNVSVSVSFPLAECRRKQEKQNKKYGSKRKEFAAHGVRLLREVEEREPYTPILTEITIVISAVGEGRLRGRVNA